MTLITFMTPEHFGHIRADVPGMVFLWNMIWTYPTMNVAGRTDGQEHGVIFN
jgi:hypothetical protein